MTDDMIATFLKSAALFAGLSEPELTAVRKRMQMRRFTANQLIFSRGDAGDGAYLIVEGRVRLSLLTEDGRELSLALAGPGAFFGEIAAFDGGERTADATAMTMTETLFLSRQALQAELQCRPAMADAAIRLLCARLRATDQRLEAIALHAIEVRLARFLLASLEETHPGAGSGWHPLTLGLTQSEIGLLIGASRPKVNQALTVLEEMKAIRRDGATIFCDLRRISDACRG